MNGRAVDLSAPYGSTTLSNFEVWMMGEAFWSWLALPARMGWASPASALDYTKDGRALGLSGLIMRDFVAWTSGRTDTVEPGLEERIAELVQNSRMDHQFADRVPDLSGGVA